MDVYILLERDYEGDKIIEVYKNEEEAQKHMDIEIKEHPEDKNFYIVQKFEVKMDLES